MLVDLDSKNCATNIDIDVLGTSDLKFIDIFAHGASVQRKCNILSVALVEKHLWINAFKSAKTAKGRTVFVILIKITDDLKLKSKRKDTSEYRSRIRKRKWRSIDSTRKFTIIGK